MGDLEDEALLDEQREGLQGAGQRCRWRLVERAGVPGRQNVDDVGAQRHGLGDGGVVGDATVDEIASGDAHRREHGRDGGAGQDRVDGIAIGQQHLLAAGDVGGDDVQRDGGVLEPLEGEVLADETT